MLASFFASNYAFYAAASQGYTQGVIYPNYLNPQFAGYSPMMAKNSTSGNMTSVTSNTQLEEQEDSYEETPKSVKYKKNTTDTSLVKFSIARILGETSAAPQTSNDVEDECDKVVSEPTSHEVVEDGLQYSWLHCTRYKPPKLQRVRKRESTKKRKLGRNPRVPFTQQQVGALEQKFFRTHYLSSMDVAELSTALNLTETRVKIWFQNRRARERRERETRQRDGTGRKSHVGDNSWLVTSQSSSTVTRVQNVLHAGHSAFKPVRLPNFKGT